jgi:hypothetical protein
LPSKAKELARFHGKRAGEFDDVEQANVALAALHSPYICAMET